ncbi:hypothetical protein [Hydrogenophaga sp. 2FB]|uniref:hypothetical protein n=1 Tax=Hydrogenophaga sp. 2FB TaxID=2502187 RepID=UPI0010F9E0BC|nr:hypothetical protein [Hydrogenophaga sp. 2FB]
MFSRTKPASIAPGYPTSNKVQVKKLKGGGYMLLNGTTAFQIPIIAPFKTISVKSGDGGEGTLIGTDGQGMESTLASFGNVEIAGTAHAALIKAHAGMSEGGWGWFGKSALTLAVLWIMVNLFSAPSAPSIPVAAAQGAQEQFAPSQLESPSVAIAQGSNPTRSLDDLANGGYQFSPQVQAPDFKAPQLNCEPS